MKTLEDVIKVTRDVIAENPDKINPMSESGTCLADWTSRGLFVLFLAVIFVCFVGAMQENKWNS